MTLQEVADLCVNTIGNIVYFSMGVRTSLALNVLSGIWTYLDISWHVCDNHNSYLKAKHAVFLTLTKWLLCLNLTRQQVKCCHSIF